MQAFCSARLEFLYVSACHAGSTHDAVAYDSTALADALSAGDLPAQYYVVGDEAYSATKQFLTPWSGRQLSVDKDSYNYHHSLMRQVIERAFGVLTRRWGIFWSPLQSSLCKWATIVQVCCRLHNLCIGTNTDPPLLNDEEEQRAAAALAEMNTPLPNRSGRRDTNEACPRRLMLTNLLAENGYIRPGHSSFTRCG